MPIASAHGAVHPWAFSFALLTPLRPRVTPITSSPTATSGKGAKAMMRQPDSAITRRDFVHFSAALLGASCCGKLWADEKKSDAYGGFTVGAQSYCFRNFDREQALKKIQALGLHYVEFFQKHAPLEST